MNKGKHTLLYSAKAAKKGANKAVTNDGIIVEYTCMHDEKKGGKWEGFYLWPDVIVVGYIDRYSQITEYHVGRN